MCTVRAGQGDASTLVFVELRALELQVAAKAAFRARVGHGVAWAEALLAACKTDGLSLVMLRVVQHLFLEVVLLQHLLAGVAGVGLSLALAVHASVRIAMEGAWYLLLSARSANVASGASQIPVL